MVIPDALRGNDDGEPVRQTILGATNNKATSVFSGFDNVPKNRVVRCRVPWNAFLVERRKQLTKAIGPSRIRVDDISTYKLWWRISEADGVCSNRNHEPRIIKSGRYDSADRQFLLHTRLACVLCENNDLLDSSEAFCRSRSRSRHPLGDVACPPKLDSPRSQVSMTTTTQNHCLQVPRGLQKPCLVSGARHPSSYLLLVARLVQKASNSRSASRHKF